MGRLLEGEHASTPQSGVEAPRLLKRSLTKLYYCCCCCCCFQFLLCQKKRENWLKRNASKRHEHDGRSRRRPANQSFGVHKVNRLKVATNEIERFGTPKSRVRTCGEECHVNSKSSYFSLRISLHVAQRVPLSVLVSVDSACMIDSS